MDSAQTLAAWKRGLARATTVVDDRTFIALLMAWKRGRITGQEAITRTYANWVRVAATFHNGDDGCVSREDFLQEILSRVPEYVAKYDAERAGGVTIAGFVVWSTTRRALKVRSRLHRLRKPEVHATSEDITAHFNARPHQPGSERLAVRDLFAGFDPMTPRAQAVSVALERRGWDVGGAIEELWSDAVLRTMASIFEPGEAYEAVAQEIERAA